ncbi:MAG: diguanylate cyclase [Parasulfuritortus sp.]|jgi:diguanylate cyclase (GGDEF)-like protein/PAS domain S-box-containing protein|nr:diguanylate cyclase [Parasulfuritortus sp.]
MQIAPLPANELERLEALRKYDILDTVPETAFDAMVQLAAYICQTPIAAISLVDERRQWFKAIVGLDARETSRDVAFCAHTILQDETMIVPDAQKDIRFCDNPLVASAPDIRFYAGVPLVTADGYHLGTLCVIDRVPRELTDEQLEAIKVLANNIMAHLDLRLSHKHIRQYVDDLQLAATIFDASSEAMVVTDAENRIITVNPAFTATTGYSINEVVGRTPNLLKSGKQSEAFYQEMWHTLDASGHWNGEVWNLRKNGELYAEWLSINVIYNEDGTKRLHVAIFSDITKKKQAEELIWSHANYDHLTQLPNRRLFRDRLEQSIKMAHRTGNSLALLFIDLDRFKAVNDSHGHDIGDTLLKMAAIRIQQCVRDMDTVARMGGDEFTVILSQLSDPSYADNIAEVIIQTLSGPFTIDGEALLVSASIGITNYPADANDLDQLIKNADKAMYAAKNDGRGRYCHYTPVQ